MTSLNNSLQEGNRSKHVYSEDFYPIYRVERLEVMIPVSIIGIIFNIFNIIVLTRKKMTSSINVTLTCLAVSDLTCVIFEITVPMIIQTAMPSEIPTGYSTYALAIVSLMDYYVAYWSSNVSIWITVIIGIWRCVAVTAPFKAQTWCTARRAKFAVIVAVFFSAVIASPEIFMYGIRSLSNNNSSTVQVYELHYSSMALAKDYLLYRIYQHVYVIMKLVPCIILTFLTFVLIWSLCRAAAIRRQMSGKGEHTSNKDFDRTTAMMLTILAFFLISNSPYAILITLLLTLGKSQLKVINFSGIEDYLQIVVMMNYIVNFPIYMIIGRKFRKTFLETFCFAFPKITGMLRTSSSATAKTDTDDCGSLKTTKFYNVNLNEENEKNTTVF